MYTYSPQQPILTTLKGRLRRLEQAHRPRGEVVSSGSQALDRLLERGFRRGSLIEYLAVPGSGAMALAWIAAREACRAGGSLIVIDPQLYPPAANSLGLDMANVVFVRPRTRKDRLWTFHQALRCQGIGAVICCPDKLNDRAYRGLQLAAETGGTLGLFVRPVDVRGDSTWSEVQLVVEALPAIGANRRVRVEIIRCRTGKVGAAVELELDDENGTLQESRPVHLASSMAVAAGVQHSSRA